MTEAVDNLVLEHLRAIRADLSTVKEDVREIKHRMTNVEAAIGGLKRDQAADYVQLAEQHGRYDRLVERVERIERRLELQE